MASSSGLDNTGGDDQGMDFQGTEGTEEVFEDVPHDDGEEFEEDLRHGSKDWGDEESFCFGEKGVATEGR